MLFSNTFTCYECRDEYDPKEGKEVVPGITLCRICAFWAERVKNRSRFDSVRCKGQMYVIGPEPEKPGREHGNFGHAYRITFKDGRVVTTHNLWDEGSIPEHFRDRLPNNAKVEEL